MCYNADGMRGITTTQSSFQEFIELDALYVDKTMYAYSLVKDPMQNFFFISRPRRYGKSLFCSTLHALFDGRKDLFKGLCIAERTDYSFERYPVLHFDFSPLDTTDMESFLSCFRLLLRIQAENNGITIADGSPAAMLTELLEALIRKEGKKVVIIIDEFDSPMTAAMDKEFIGTIRDVFSAFYAVIKMNSPRIRFLFITGVAKLSNLSIFSRMNNLVDLSMNPRFASAFGYTDDELLEYFGEGIEEYFEAHPDWYASKDGFASRIREYYDGYRFSPDSDVTVYNPVSIGYFFNEDCRFRNYWNMTGVPTLAVSLASEFPLSDILGDDLSLPMTAFTTFDISQIYEGGLSRESVLAMLYYTGYLTIKDAAENVITLGFPNIEVAASFTAGLLPRYRMKDAENVEVWLSRLLSACRAGNEDMVRKKMEEYFAAFSYELAERDPERTYHAIFHSIFVMAGLDAISEDRGARGRADEALKAGDHIWVFELKVDRSADEALSQIEERDYGKRYAYLMRPGMVLHKVGIAFSSKERRISDWKSL